jgi:hypothetical protein
MGTDQARKHVSVFEGVGYENATGRACLSGTLRTTAFGEISVPSQNFAYLLMSIAIIWTWICAFVVGRSLVW